MLPGSMPLRRISSSADVERERWEMSSQLDVTAVVEKPDIAMIDCVVGQHSRFNRQWVLSQIWGLAPRSVVGGDLWLNPKTRVPDSSGDLLCGGGMMTRLGRDWGLFLNPGRNSAPLHAAQPQRTGPITTKGFASVLKTRVWNTKPAFCGWVRLTRGLFHDEKGQMSCQRDH